MSLTTSYILRGALLGALSVAGFAQPSGGPPPANVTVDEARMEVIAQMREVTGSLRAVRRSVLGAEEEGLIIALEVEEGGEVKAGDVIARQDDAIVTIEVDRTTATRDAKTAVVMLCEAELDRAKREQTRMEDASGRGSGSGMELDERRTLVRAWEARLAEAKAEERTAAAVLAVMQRRRTKMTIRAPFDGQIVSRRTELGQWAQTGDAIVEMVSAGRIEARLDVPDFVAATIVPGQTLVRIRISSLGLELDSTGAQVIPDADPLSRLVPLRVFLSNDERKLNPGMSVTGLVPTGTAAPTLTVHKDAILRDNAGEYLFFLAGPSAVPARVRTKYAIGDRVAIEPGPVPPGAKVIIEGNERLFPGQTVNVLNGDVAGGEVGGTAGGAAERAAEEVPAGSGAAPGNGPSGGTGS